MSSSQIARRDFGRRLREWDALRARGDRDASLAALVQLTQDVHDYECEGPEGFLDQEMDLLGFLVAELQERGWHREAVTVCSAASSLPNPHAKLGPRIRLSLQGVHSCCATLDLERGFDLLGECLGLDGDVLAQQPEHWIRSVAVFEVPGLSENDLTRLRYEALVASGRCLAAAGRLYSAQGAYELAGVALESLREPGASASADHTELAYAIAELCLDQGNLDPLEDALASMADEGGADARWTLVWAQVLAMRGRWSEALHRLATVSAQPSTPGVADRLRWTEIQISMLLNDYDECERLLGSVDDNAGTTEYEEIAALLRERRVASFASVLPPARAILLPSLERGGVEKLPENLPVDVGDHRLERTSERLRDDYGRWFNVVLVALHRRMLPEAAVLTKALEEWSGSSESELLRAKQDHLWALVQYYGGAFGDAAISASRAAERYRRLGLTPDLSTMYVVLWRAAVELGRPSEEVEQLGGHAIELQKSVAAGLSPGHRGHYQLNKWTTIDYRSSEICERLRARLHHEKPIGRQRRKYVRSAVDAVFESSWAGEGGGRRGGGTAAPAGQDPHGWADEARGRRADFVAHRQLESTSPVFLAPGEVVVKYLAFPHRLVILCLDSSGWKLVEPDLPSTKAELWRASRLLLRQLVGPASWRCSPALVEMQRRLALDRLGAEYPPGTRLTFVPDDATLHVPFSAIPILERPACARHPICVVPSFRWDARGLRGRIEATSGLVVAVSGTEVEGYSSFEGTEEAGVRVAGRWEKCRWRMLTGGDATRDGVLAVLGGADIIQFFCHGYFDEDRASASGFVLSDTCLTARDLSTADLRHCRLVFLGSCWGADGVTLPGGMRVGAPFTLLDRGAESVVAPLWDVPIEASLDFVDQAHEKLRGTGVVDGISSVQARWAEASRPCREWAGWTTYQPGVSTRWWAKSLLSMRAGYYDALRSVSRWSTMRL